MIKLVLQVVDFVKHVPGGAGSDFARVQLGGHLVQLFVDGTVIDVFIVGGRCLHLRGRGCGGKQNEKNGG